MLLLLQLKANWNWLHRCNRNNQPELWDVTFLHKVEKGQLWHLARRRLISDKTRPERKFKMYPNIFPGVAPPATSLKNASAGTACAPTPTSRFIRYSWSWNPRAKNLNRYFQALIKVSATGFLKIDKLQVDSGFPWQLLSSHFIYATRDIHVVG